MARSLIALRDLGDSDWAPEAPPDAAHAPDLDPRTIYTTCVSKARPKAKARLQALEATVAAAAAEIDRAAETAALHALGHLQHQGWCRSSVSLADHDGLPPSLLVKQLLVTQRARVIVLCVVFIG